MSEPIHTTLAITEAERLIAAGHLAEALGQLQAAAQNVPTDHADAAVLFAQIQDALRAVVAADPQYAPEAQAVRDVVVRRAAHLDVDAVPMPPRTVARATSAGAVEIEPWFYGAGQMVATLAVIASILSLLGGFVVGVEVSKYTVFTNGPPETHHHGGVVAYWTVIGVFAAALWLAVAVGLELLLEIGRSLRSARSKS